LTVSIFVLSQTFREDKLRGDISGLLTPRMSKKSHFSIPNRPNRVITARFSAHGLFLLTGLVC
jgi:hypothetical protein